MQYVAYGLTLDCSFKLPGMGATQGGSEAMPLLSLARLEPEELADRWEPAGAEPEWRGRLGDGLELRIDRGRNADVLFSYGDRARFHLRDGASRLDCAIREHELDSLRVLIGKVLPSVSVMLGREGLHAAALDGPNGVIAIMAPSGTGKSTLAIELLHRGMGLFADDALILERADGGVRAHPGTPHMNLDEQAPGEADPAALGSELARLAGELWLSAHHTIAHPRPVSALCLLDRGEGLVADATVEPANPLMLAPYMLGLSMEPERQRSRFELYADLMETALLVRLTGAPEHTPAQLADVLGRTLQQARPRAGAGAGT